MRATVSALSRWAYHPSPTRFGRYPLLNSEMAMTTYPDPRPVPAKIPRPAYVPANFFTAPWGEHETVASEILATKPRALLDEQGVQGVRKAGKAVAEILREVGKLVKPGVTTNQLDEAAHEMMISRGAYPSTLGYWSFPRSCTTSVNNVIAHGIPDHRPLHPEDIINIDLTLYLDGYHGDSSRTFLLPAVDKPGRELVEACEEALEVGIRVCGPGRKWSDIGKAIQEFASKYGFSVNDQFTGHGIGRDFHQEPYILHYRNTEQGQMQPGDCFTIEPCLVQGSDARGDLWDDGWTMSTLSGARSAQFEHQVLITEDGVEVLTRV